MNFVGVLKSVVACLLLAGLSLSVPGVAFSQENDKPAAATDPAKRFAELAARKAEIIKKLQQMQKDFATADSAGKQKIQQEFRSLITEFQGKIQTEMADLAPKVYKQDPKNNDAAEVVMEMEFSKNNYPAALAIADKLMAANHKNAVVSNIAGVSNFAMHNFEKAQQILQEAEKDDELLPQLGGRYLEHAGEYIARWKAEQAIREKESAAEGDQLLPHVVFETSRGNIEFELFENQAPNTVANFVNLIENKKYDGTKFHRVIPGFMAQGGDPNSLDDNPANDGSGGPGYTIECECYRDDARLHFRGSLSMAHAGKDTGGSQFFITHLPTDHLNPNAEAMRGHTVFGRIVKGFDVAAALEVGDVIEQARVTQKRRHAYKPKTTAKGTGE